MDPKDNFFASLSDKQLGFFYAHEYDKNLYDLLQDELSMAQYRLFETWKEYESTTLTTKNAALLPQQDLLEKMSQIIENLAEKLESIETKMDQKFKSLEETYSLQLANIERKIKESGKQLSKEIEVLRVEIMTSYQVPTSLMNKVDDIWTNSILGAGKNLFIFTTLQHLLSRANGNIGDFCCRKRSLPVFANINVDANEIKFEALTMNDKTSLGWFIGFRKRIIESNSYITRFTVRTIFEILRTFENSEKIQESGFELLEIMIDKSNVAVDLISTTPGAIECLIAMLKKPNKQQSLHEKIFCILINIADGTTHHHLLTKTDYISQLSEELTNTKYANSVLYSGLVLAPLLNTINLSEEFKEVDNKIVSAAVDQLKPSSIQQVGSYLLFKNRPVLWYIKQITDGTKAQQYFCTYVVACISRIQSVAQKYKDAGVINMLEKVLTNENTDSFVKTHASEALKYFKM